MKKVFCIIILLLFCIPYAYLGTYLELAGWGLWGYFISIAVPYILSSQASKLDNKYIVFAGFMLSLSASLFCAVNFVTERWWSFCKPLSPKGVVILDSFFVAVFAFAGWHIQKEIMDRKSKKNKKSAG